MILSLIIIYSTLYVYTINFIIHIQFYIIKSTVLHLSTDIL